MMRQGPDRTLELELQTLISRRYRGVYLHDLRGGLQVIQNAVEVLVRMANASAQASAQASATTPAGASRGDSSMAVRTSDLARRALAAHGNLIDATLDRLVPAADAPASCSASAVVREVVSFLRAPFAAKSMALQAVPGAEVTLRVPASRLRLSLLVVLTALLDAPRKAGTVQVSLERDGPWGTLVVSAAPSAPQTADAAHEIDEVEGPFDLSIRRRLVGLDGGEVECGPGPDGTWRQELRYPVAADEGKT